MRLINVCCCCCVLIVVSLSHPPGKQLKYANSRTSDKRVLFLAEMQFLVPAWKTGSLFSYMCLIAHKRDVDPYGSARAQQVKRGGRRQRRKFKNKKRAWVKMRDNVCRHQFTARKHQVRLAARLCHPERAWESLTECSSGGGEFNLVAQLGVQMRITGRNRSLSQARTQRASDIS